LVETCLVKYDKDGTGGLTTEEFVKLIIETESLRKLMGFTGKNPDPAEIEDFILKHDTNGDNLMSVGELFSVILIAIEGKFKAK
jgi:Ca2+-binding EF-hand superfamily protein